MLEVRGSGTPVAMEHFVYGSCAPHEFVDYHLGLSLAHDGDMNLFFELELRDDVNDPNALQMHLWRGPVPDNRHTEFVAHTAVGGIAANL